MTNAEAANVDLFECVVLSALMNGADTLPVRADDFSSPPNRLIFNRVSGLKTRGLLAVTDALRRNRELEKVGGAHRVTEISLMPHDAQNLEYALANVLEYSRARQAAKIGERLHKGEIGFDEALKQLEALNRDRADDTLTVLTPDEISALPKIPNACLLGDNVIQKGGSTVVAGAGGIGKTKLVLQFIVAKNTGRQWCGMETHGPPMDWLYLQNENGRDRLERDLQALRKWAPDFDQSRLHIQVYQTDDDGFLCLDDPETVARIKRTVQKFSPDGLIVDPLRDFGVGNLDSDADMIATVRALAKIGRAGNPHRVLIPVHHALTGRAGAVKSFGLERSGFARNSKALLFWARAQINVSPGKEDSNEILLISCGKNNDGKEFPRVAVRLNPDTMIYEVDPDFDFEAWDEQLTAAGKRKKPKFNVEMVKELVKFSGEKDMAGLAALIQKKTGCGQSRAYELVHEGRKARIFRYSRNTELYAVA